MDRSFPRRVERLRVIVAAAALAIFACASHPALSAYSAGRLAARLANDRCQSRFGQRPFSAEDFEAVYAQGQWHWGADGKAVDGFHADVSFGPYGNDPKVAVDGAEK